MKTGNPGLEAIARHIDALRRTVSMPSSRVRHSRRAYRDILVGAGRTFVWYTSRARAT